MSPKIEMTESECALKILKEIEFNPHLTQRYLAHRFGISLGKINSLIGAFLDKGLIKVSNFKRSNNKTGYIYMLTMEGIQKRVSLTHAFLSRRLLEYEELKKELESISAVR